MGAGLRVHHKGPGVHEVNFTIVRLSMLQHVRIHVTSWTFSKESIQLKKTTLTGSPLTCCFVQLWNIWVPFGVPIIRTIVFWGLYWGALSLGNYHLCQHAARGCAGSRDCWRLVQQVRKYLGI